MQNVNAYLAVQYLLYYLAGMDGDVLGAVSWRWRLL